VDEGNNWINVSSGPLAISDDSVAGGANSNYGGGDPFGNYSLLNRIDNIPATGDGAQPHPITDFFGNPRPDPANTRSFDPGAVEIQGGGAVVGPPTFGTINPNHGVRGTSVNVTITGTNFTSGTNATVCGVTATNVNVNQAGTQLTATVNLAGVFPGSCNVRVATVNGAATGNGAFTVTGATLNISTPPAAVAGSPALNSGGTNGPKKGSITVTNTAVGANAGAFTFTAAPSVTKIGPNGGTFTIDPSSTCTSTTVLNPAAGGNPAGSCTIVVDYAPGGSAVTAGGRVTVTGTGLANPSQNGSIFFAN
jgi:hypothetical protein